MANWFRVFLFNESEDSEAEFILYAADQQAAIKRAQVRKRQIFGDESSLWVITNVRVEVEEV